MCLFQYLQPPAAQALINPLRNPQRRLHILITMYQPHSLAIYVFQIKAPVSAHHCPILQGSTWAMLERLEQRGDYVVDIGVAAHVADLGFLLVGLALVFQYALEV
jgi:hypothetical protein